MYAYQLCESCYCYHYRYFHVNPRWVHAVEIRMHMQTLTLAMHALPTHSQWVKHSVRLAQTLLTIYGKVYWERC